MAKSSRTSVLIVGAGPTGLNLAIWLRKLSPNLRVRIVDRAEGPCSDTRAVTVHARTLEYYRQLGFVDSVLAEGLVVNGVEVHVKGSKRGSLSFLNVGREESKYPFVFTYSQDEHERLLVRHFESLGGVIEWQKEVVRLEMLADGENAVAFADGEELQAQFVAGCDGVRSTIRKQTALKMEGNFDCARLFVADISLPTTKEDFGRLRMYPDAQGITMYVPLKDNQARLFGALHRTAPVDAMFEDYKPVMEQTMRQTFAVNWSSIYRVSHTIAASWRKGNVFLLGDAANVHSPLGGQGMNSGIGDATNLAWKLAQVLDSRAGKALLDTYEPERRDFAERLTRTTDFIFNLATMDGVVGWFVRKIMLSHVLPVLWARTYIPYFYFRAVSQISITYRSLGFGIRAAAAPSKIRPGDRLPWVRFEDGDNFECLKSCSWQIHRYDARNGIDSATLYGLPFHRFPQNQRAAYVGLDPRCDFLIRPDGHVAVISNIADSRRDIADFCERWKMTLTVD